MKISTLALLLAAVLVGSLAAFIARGIIVSRPAGPQTTLVVAAEPLTFGADLTDDNLIEVPWAASVVPVGAFTSKAELFKDIKEGRRIALSPVEKTIWVMMVAKGLPVPPTPPTTSRTELLTLVLELTCGNVVLDGNAGFAGIRLVDCWVPTMPAALPFCLKNAQRMPRLRAAVRSASTKRTLSMTCCGLVTFSALTRRPHRRGVESRRGRRGRLECIRCARWLRGRPLLSGRGVRLRLQRRHRNLRRWANRTLRRRL